MSAKPDGGPAFAGYRAGETFQTGMSLRDYFAIHAPEPSPEYINSEGERDRLANPHGDTYKPPRRSRGEIIAGYKYAYADAMLAERAK